MYAIIETGSKQYRVQEGDKLAVELLGDGPVEFKAIFLHDGETSKVGAPYVPNCVVHAEVLGIEKGPKVVAFKYKKCKNYRRTVGHRQKYSEIKITKIVAA